MPLRKVFHPIVFAMLLGMVLISLAGFVDLLWSLAAKELKDDSVWLVKDFRKLLIASLWIYGFSVGCFGCVINVMKAVGGGSEPVKKFDLMDDLSGSERGQIERWLDTGEAQTRNTGLLLGDES